MLLLIGKTMKQTTIKTPITLITKNGWLDFNKILANFDNVEWVDYQLDNNSQSCYFIKNNSVTKFKKA